MQLVMWVRFCGVARRDAGEGVDGVRVGGDVDVDRSVCQLVMRTRSSWSFQRFVEALEVPRGLHISALEVAQSSRSKLL